MMSAVRARFCLQIDLDHAFAVSPLVVNPSIDGHFEDHSIKCALLHTGP